MEDSYKHIVQNNSESKEYTLSHSISIKIENRQNQTRILKIRIVVNFQEEGEENDEGLMGLLGTSVLECSILGPSGG